MRVVDAPPPRTAELREIEVTHPKALSPADSPAEEESPPVMTPIECRIVGGLIVLLIVSVLNLLY